jgi:hypothetical protein
MRPKIFRNRKAAREYLLDTPDIGWCGSGFVYLGEREFSWAREF